MHSWYFMVTPNKFERHTCLDHLRAKQWLSQSSQRRSLRMAIGGTMFWLVGSLGLGFVGEMLDQSTVSLKCHPLQSSRMGSRGNSPHLFHQIFVVVAVLKPGLGVDGRKQYKKIVFKLHTITTFENQEKLIKNYLHRSYLGFLLVSSM